MPEVKFDWTVEIPDGEFDGEVLADLDAADPSVGYGGGVSLRSVRLHADGREVLPLLDGKQLEALCEKASERYAEEEVGRYEDAMERRAEALADQELEEYFERSGEREV